MSNKKVYIVADPWDGTKNTKNCTILGVVSDPSSISPLQEERKKIQEERLPQVEKCKHCSFASALAKDIRFVGDKGEDLRVEGLPDCFNTNVFNMKRVAGGKVKDDDIIECECFKSAQTYVPEDYMVEEYDLDTLAIANKIEK